MSEMNTGCSVLLIDDDEFVRKALRAMLMVNGFTVIEAANGISALELFHHHKEDIHFVICDLIMPKMNGWETLANLRQLSSNTPLILSSGYFDPDIMNRDYFEGPQAFLSKPFTLKELNDTIREISRDRREPDLS